jgi:Na+/H+ antiporter NhaD/arsenite permease-like protein
VGVLIGQSTCPPLSFADFIVWSFPVMLLMLAATIVLLGWWYRKDIRLLTERLEARRGIGLGLGPLVRVPYQRGLLILACLIAFIALHAWIEGALGLAPNTVLMVAPLVTAGVLMVWRHGRARHYIETEVEWWTLLFFMMLFAKAGTLEQTQVTQVIADGFSGHIAHQGLLMPVIIGMTAVGSAFLDNIVFVAAFMPVVDKLDHTPLVWALLHGACMGGNITMIGSTANIVALGLLEKRYRTQIRFGEWVKIGLLVGLATCAISWGCLFLLAPHMPSTLERHQEANFLVADAAASSFKCRNPKCGKEWDAGGRRVLGAEAAPAPRAGE